MPVSPLRLPWSSACAVLVVLLVEIAYTLLLGTAEWGHFGQCFGMVMGTVGVMGLPLWVIGLAILGVFACLKGAWRWAEPEGPDLAQSLARVFALLIALAFVCLGGYLAARYGLRHFRKHVYIALAAGLGGAAGAAVVGALMGPLLAFYHRCFHTLLTRLPPVINPSQPSILRGWVVCISALCLFIAPLLITPLHTVDLRGLRVACVFVIALEFFYHRHQSAVRRPRNGRLAMVSGLFLATFVWASQSLGDDPFRVLSIERDTVIAGPILRAVETLFDADGDGVPSLFSGGDCNDSDPTIRPGVFDPPSDGIDQNCTGADYTPPKKVPTPSTTLPANVAKDWNVVLITVDALRADVVKKLMPNVVAFAEQGIIFDSGYSHGATTYWSLPALLASKMPSQIHMGRDQTPVNSELLLTEVLKSHGWHTALFANVTIFFVRGLRQGFQMTDYETSHFTVHGAKPGSRHMTDSVLRYVERWQAGKARTVRKKLFLWAHYYDPHEPYFEVPDYQSKGDDDRSRYDAIVQSVDAQIGRLLDGFKKRGLWKNTIFIMTADHGEEFGDHGHRHHGRTVYDEVTRVPFIIKVPGVPPRRDHSPMGHIDLAPTLLEFLGLPIPSKFRGVSRVRQIKTLEKMPLEPVFLEVFPDSNYDAHLVAMRLGRHKLIYHVNRNYFELYDLANDPKERKNLIASAPFADALKKRLLAYVDQHLYDLARGKTGAKKPRGSPGKVPAVKR